MIQLQQKRPRRFATALIDVITILAGLAIALPFLMLIFLSGLGGF